MRLYSTLSGEEEEFVASHERVSLYVCGITPYGPCHVGHAMSYVIFDVLRRYLEFRGYDVAHIQNITDIDDKIIKRSNEQQVDHTELTARYIDDFTSNMDRLNIKRAHNYPLATEAIPRMIDVIQNLIDKEYAYSSRGDVYFRVTKSPDYGKLSHRSLGSMIAGARVEVIEGKEHPMDFTLWKSAKTGEPSWDSPWGPGRPGWHIECSTISLDHLGQTIDIHGGGQDLIFPHHENEIAQSEAYTGQKPSVRFWVHNGLLQLEEEKMSKSLGNLVAVSDALDRHSADALRLFFLSSHYRSPLNYSDQGVTAMERGSERLQTALRKDSASNGDQLDTTRFKEAVMDAMDADLNTPQAIAALFDLAHEINRARERGEAITLAQEDLRELGSILGLTFSETVTKEELLPETFTGFYKEITSNLRSAGLNQLTSESDSLSESPDATTVIEALLAIRQELRRIRKYDLADVIRSRLEELGISLEDTKQGTLWRPLQPTT